jgi:hypothetical protein
MANSIDHSPFPLYHESLLHPPIEPERNAIAALPQILKTLHHALHLLSTDSDLDECVSRPEIYDVLELEVRLSLAALHGVELDPKAVAVARQQAESPVGRADTPAIAPGTSKSGCG